MGRLKIVQGKMKAEQYVDILEKSLKESALEMGIENNFIFQQDNGLKHTSNIAIDYFYREDIYPIDHPPGSADLNPIEHLWNEVDRSIPNQYRKNMHTFQTKLFEVWSNIPPTIFRPCIEIMKDRLQAIIDNKG